MASVALPKVPESGRELEDYVAGLFQAAGYFVEKNIHQRDVTDVLELDAVATCYDGPVPTSVLAEAKAGRWGYPDLFKVAGWMAYLGIERGGVFVKDGPCLDGAASGPKPRARGAGTTPEPREPRDVARMHANVAPLGVSLVDLGDFRDPVSRLLAGGFRPFRDPLLLEVWRLSFWVERALLDGVRRERRAHPARAGAQEVLCYHDLVNDHVFFLKDVAERLRRIYAAYRSHPKLSASLAAELAGTPWAPEQRRLLPELASDLLAQAMYEGKHPLLQGSFYVEHRARVSILKAAIDLAILAEEDGAVGAGSAPPSTAFATLPATFREGLSRLRERPSHRRYALLWQVFLWGFGGFWLADREEEEFGLLAAQTGIPASEIGDGLRAFDDLFPLPHGSWIVPVKGTSLRLAKMVPVAFRGVGAVQRLRRAGAGNYDGLGLGSAGRRNLITWHNALVRLLGASPPGAPRS